MALLTRVTALALGAALLACTGGGSSDDDDTGGGWPPGGDTGDTHDTGDTDDTADTDDTGDTDDSGDSGETGMEPILDADFAGTLSVTLTNTLPAFEASATMDAYVSQYGVVQVAGSSLSYEGSEDVGDGCVYTRSGTWLVNPTGAVEGIDPDWTVAIVENVAVTEQQTMVCPEIGTVFDETLEGFSDGGLGFNLAEATLGAAVVEASNEWGSVRWVLALTAIPVD